MGGDWSSFLIKICVMIGLPLLGLSATGQDAYPTVDESKIMIEQYPYSYEAWLNLGSSFLKANDKARARYCYEVAHRLSYGNEHVKNNITYLKRQLPKEVLELPDFFLHRWRSQIAGFLSPFVWMIISILIWIGIAANLYLLLLKRTSRVTLLRNSAIFSCLLFILTLWFGHTRKQQLNNRSEAILNSNIYLKQSPDTNSESTMQLYAGFKVVILDHIGEWTKIALLDKTQGWIPTDQLWTIEIDKLP